MKLRSVKLRNQSNPRLCLTLTISSMKLRSVKLRNPQRPRLLLKRPVSSMKLRSVKLRNDVVGAERGLESVVPQ